MILYNLLVANINCIITKEANNEENKLYSLFAGLCDDLSALHNHCNVLTLYAPSNVPGLNGTPSPMSPNNKSPSTSLSFAISKNKKLMEMLIDDIVASYIQYGYALSIGSTQYGF